RIDVSTSALRADAYGKALADVFTSAKGEVCFSLFGAWGRGKTHLARVFERNLPEDCASVWFSAWKYPSQPELWVFLYETFRAVLAGTPWLRRIPMLFWANARR